MALALAYDTRSPWHERYRRKRDAEVDAIGAADKVDLYLLTSPDVAGKLQGIAHG